MSETVQPFVQEIPLEDVVIPATRKRPVERASVLDLAKSIEREGLLHPIGVKPVENGWELIYGAHRVEAARELGWTAILATVFPTDLSETSARLMELQENCARNDLTGGQRKDYAAEIGQILLTISNSSDTDTVTDSWIVQMSKESGITERTMYRWWDAYCTMRGISLNPKQARDSDKQEFFAWLKEQKRQEDAERERKAQAERERRQKLMTEETLEALEDLTDEYGIKHVYASVISPWMTRYADQLHEEWKE